MRIAIKFFSSLRRLSGVDLTHIDMYEGARVGDAVALLLEKFPDIERVIPFAVVARNHRQAKPDDLLREGDELSIFPPVAGG